jgi:F-type H+-transporting ATPase subunit gamma
MDSLENLRRKLDGAGDLQSVVKAMKAVAASNIGQYEMAVSSLGEYYRTIELGVIAYFIAEKIEQIKSKDQSKKKDEKSICAIVFGSDQGLVGQFNDNLANFVSESINKLPGKKEIWSVGERVQLLLLDRGYHVTKSYSVPNSVNAITPLAGQLLVESEKIQEEGGTDEVYVFHNQPKAGSDYAPVCRRILPLDEKWRQTLVEQHWPTKKIPQVIGRTKPTLAALIHGYLFTSLFKACAESLASENASRLTAMQRAEKNIEELLDNLNHQFHSLRQSTIDEELFDVVSGFEALNNDTKKKVS